MDCSQYNISRELANLPRLFCLRQIQYEVSYWSRKNFALGSLAPLLGIVEEVGELCHATLKYHQGIRSLDNRTKYEADRNDAVGDILIFLCDYANREDIDLIEVLNETWSKVRTRD